MCATFAISTMMHYCDGEKDTLRSLNAGIPVVEVAEAEKPQLLQPMRISADRFALFEQINKALSSF